MKDLSVITFDKNSNTIFKQSAENVYEQWVFKQGINHRFGFVRYFVMLNTVAWIGVIILFIGFLFGITYKTLALFWCTLVLCYLTVYKILRYLQCKFDNDLEFSRKWGKLDWLKECLDSPDNQYKFIQEYYLENLINLKFEIKGIKNTCTEIITKYTQRINTLLKLDREVATIVLKQRIIYECKEIQKIAKANIKRLDEAIGTVSEAILELQASEEDLGKARSRRNELLDVKQWVSDINVDLAVQIQIQECSTILNDVLLPHQKFINGLNIQTVIDNTIEENDKAIAYLELKMT